LAKEVGVMTSRQGVKGLTKQQHITHKKSQTNKGQQDSNRVFKRWPLDSKAKYLVVHKLEENGIKPIFKRFSSVRALTFFSYPKR